LNSYDILYEDDYLIAVHKPTGIFVHRSRLDPAASLFMVQEVRNLIGARVYPVHRLDRKTSGLLLMAKTKEIQSVMNKMFMDRQVHKKYLAIVRGYTSETFQIDYPIMSEKGKLQESITTFTTLQTTEIPESSGRFSTSRYSLVEAVPLTGRMHQIRRHLSHIFHPIIGDRPHGCNKQNRFFLQRFGLSDMMLQASSLQFAHPITGHDTYIYAPIKDEFKRVYKILGFEENGFIPKANAQLRLFSTEN
jgi:tRNA pseudouridine65 synthase